METYTSLVENENDKDVCAEAKFERQNKTLTKTEVQKTTPSDQFVHHTNNIALLVPKQLQSSFPLQDPRKHNVNQKILLHKYYPL